MIDLWLPPKPAILRAWKREDLRSASFLPGMFPAGAARSAVSSFPVIVNTNTGNEAAADTTHSAPLPASLVSGNLLLLVGALYGTAARTYSDPSGWTPMFQSSGTGDLRSLAAWYRVSDGTEGSSLAMTTSGNAFKVTICYQISGYVGVPEWGTTATGSSSNPNPPTLTASWGVKKNLFFAAMAHVGNATAQTEPTNYTNIVQDVALNSALARPRCAVATRQLEASNDDPGTFGLSVAGWAANTIVVRGLG